MFRPEIGYRIERIPQIPKPRGLNVGNSDIATLMPDARQTDTGQVLGVRCQIYTYPAARKETNRERIQPLLGSFNKSKAGSEYMVRYPVLITKGRLGKGCASGSPGAGEFVNKEQLKITSPSLLDSYFLRLLRASRARLMHVAGHR
ncbi:hypothetical protein BOTNAR_0418g00090 [Botryotinia narcissicola]|uniref:Uncharacterized protein n=1 Tax=Botryotinia narcissicola TaxID=278944 RepID=A0A4Z1HLS7_9HELO|nr:hypothetical protein BOTNAR_0418g00090 [Botryotinia narcissicola]